MKLATKIAFAVGGLLVISACGSEHVPIEPATQAATVPVAVSAVPSSASSASSISASAPASPLVERRIVTSRRSIPFTTVRVNDSALSKGSTKVRNAGTPGAEILTYRVTFRDGIQTRKELVRREIVKAPVNRVIAVGTKETQQCDPNYSGACVPIASDVDCAGGSGNGPAYVQGPVQVIGTDIYGLDRDGDGIGCEDG
jgi:resuscitation-promoting factor RpfB